MKHNYTKNSLISYLFGESPLLAKLEIEHWIEEERVVLKDYNHLKSNLEILPKVKFSPSSESVNCILFLSSEANAAFF